jgi:hypothetical protein
MCFIVSTVKTRLSQAQACILESNLPFLCLLLLEEIIWGRVPESRFLQELYQTQNPGQNKACTDGGQSHPYRSKGTGGGIKLVRAGSTTPMLAHPSARPTALRSRTPASRRTIGPKTAPDKAETIMPTPSTDSIS